MDIDRNMHIESLDMHTKDRVKFEVFTTCPSWEVPQPSPFWYRGTIGTGQRRGMYDTKNNDLLGTILAFLP
jgi:hypothetical protein